MSSSSQRSAYLELTYGQRVALAFALKPTSLVSFITSAWIAILIFRDKTRMRKMYHRLALGMCITSACNSLIFFFQSWSIPSGTPGSIDAVGSIFTCTLTGFLNQVGFAVQYYYVSLALYVFLALRCEFRIKEIYWLEKYIHFFAFFIPTSSAIFLASAQMFNPIGMACWIQSVPEGCDRELYSPCVRGSQNSRFYVLTFGVLPTAINLVIASTLIIACYINEQIKYRKKFSSGKLVGKTIILEQARRNKSRLIARQGAFYLGTFYGSYLFPTIAAIAQVVTQRHIFPTLLMAVIFMPLDGLFFTMAYLKLRSNENSNIEKLGNTIIAQPPCDDRSNKKMENQFESEYKSQGKSRRQSWCATNTSESTNNEQTIQPRVASFSVSLFDGTDEDKWKAFGVYVGSESDSDLDDEAILNTVRKLQSCNSPDISSMDNINSNV